jgi:hypothetical protein
MKTPLRKRICYNNQKLKKGDWMSAQNANSMNPTNPAWYVRVVKRIQAIAESMHRTTIQYLKNIPTRIINYFKTKANERKRLPKRTSANRIYFLVGYTTQKHIDHRFRKEKTIHIIRNLLILSIIALLMVLAYRSIIPLIDPDQYTKMLGIENVDEMTEKDPFEMDSNNKVVTFATDATTIPEATTQEISGSEETSSDTSSVTP